MPKTFLDCALHYALRLGWPVFPLAVKSKLPLIPAAQGGHGCLDASLNETQIRGWWGRWPQANIGVATGHRFWVLDKDPKKGGEESFDYLVHQHGRFPDTIQQVSGTGGVHYLFQLPDFRIDNTDSWLAPGIDTRGYHGYIVAAPSVHPDTGKEYFWDGIDVLHKQNIAEAPAWLIEKLKTRLSPQVQRVAVVPVADKVAKGGRHNMLLSVAGSIRRRGLEADEIFATLQVVNRTRCDPPYDDAHLRKMADSIAQKPPDARYNIFRMAVPDPDASSNVESTEPITSRDVEAAVDDAITRNSLIDAVRLARDIARLNLTEQAVITVKLRDGFGDAFIAISKQFEKAIREAAALPGDKRTNSSSGPPAEPPEGETVGGYPDILWEPLTDAGNAERIVKLFGQDIRYCVEMKEWLVWDETRWAVDSMRVIRQKAKQMARILYAQATNYPNIEKHARASESFKSIKNALEIAATEKGIPISATQLDQHPYLLNCPNGVVDLRTGKLLKHERKFLITKLCPVLYDPAARCPTFQRLIEWAMGAVNQEAELPERAVRMVAFLQRAFGYALTGDVSERVFFVFYGENGKNGKTTMLTLFRKILGPDYACRLIIDTLMSMRSQDATVRADLADLRGIRLAVTSEVSKEQKLDEGKIKQITAGLDTIKSCRKYENPIEFEATHTLFMDCNYRPKIRGTDKAIWSRPLLVPFNVSVTKEEEDLQLPNKLLAESSGVLAWAVRGALAWKENGMEPPPEVEEAVKDWQHDDDPLAPFIESYCELGEGLFVAVRDLNAAYEVWCREEGVKFPVGRETFIERLEALGLEQKASRRIDEKQARTWEGIQLQSAVLDDVYSWISRRGRGGQQKLVHEGE